MELVGDTGERKVRTEALVAEIQEAEKSKRAMRFEEITKRLIAALKELPAEISLKTLSNASGLSMQTLHYRVRIRHRIEPSSPLSKRFKGESDLYSRDEILSKVSAK